MKSKRKAKLKHYGSQTSKETLLRSGKYIPPEKPIPFIYQPYYLLEKRILEPAEAWIKRQASISIMSQLAILAAIIAFIVGENTRRNNEVFTAWQTITSAEGQSGSGGRIEALEFLNSRPLRFPWIGWTQKEWFWDEGDKECNWKRLLGLRWERQPLVGLSAPNEAYLATIHLCGAKLSGAKLSNADLNIAKLSDAKLSNADLSGADLSGADLSNADLSNADLSNADLNIADNRGANFFYANLSGANLIGANLSGADFFYANLSDANLIGANLSGAYLSGTNLSGTNFFYANLSGANLTSARELIPIQVKSACYWEEAYFHPEFEQKLKQEPDQKVDCSRW